MSKSSGQGVKGKLKQFLGIQKSSGLSGARDEEREINEVLFTEDILKVIF